MAPEGPESPIVAEGWSVVRWRAARCEGRGFGRLRGTVWAGVVLAATRRHDPKRSMRPPDSEKVPKIDPGDDSLKREDRQQKNRVFLCMFLLRVTTAARGIGVESGGAEHKYRASLSPPTRNTPNHLSRLEVFDAIPLLPRGGAGPYTARAVFSLASIYRWS